jgi:hypothetical protein
VETPEETWSKIAFGVFGTINATTNIGTTVGDPLNECNYKWWWQLLSSST